MRQDHSLCRQAGSLNDPRICTVLQAQRVWHSPIQRRVVARFSGKLNEYSKPGQLHRLPNTVDCFARNSKTSSPWVGCSAWDRVLHRTQSRQRPAPFESDRHTPLFRPLLGNELECFGMVWSQLSCLSRRAAIVPGGTAIYQAHPRTIVQLSLMHSACITRTSNMQLVMLHR
ncbi:hypothetical protein BO78DRAFT_142127 [Aspergillus sclerotiicarbonarius CBS 121057]|uniref:Uncharacterized protein n=1 Tax=Aspergillus sclerotiicarbonarius (strain CBS 121057 / IBT 28362) TaxID=1448318 RepID=A0A319FG38_ASPSB|nr:hypothetical protein BO78DRAFT_142127 [Aspergillus sclerotiicarbonarius CBS 121057]